MDDDLNTMQNDILKRWQKKKISDISQEVKDILALKFQGTVLYKEPMSRHTYIKIGGPAQVFLCPQDIENAILAVKIAQKHSIPYCFHGSGANTLVKDNGVSGFVISLYNGATGIRVLEETADHYDIEATAGTAFSQFVKFAKALPATGFEELAGIPGSIGGYIKMNAGTPHRETKDIFVSATVLNKDGEIVEFTKSKMQFGYRSSGLTKTQLILKAVFRLPKATSEEGVEEKIRAVLQTRTDKQPLNFPNLGSIFKNPEPEKGLPILTAGQLIDEAGLKGVRVGGARISEKHANFIINEGQATAKDVLALIDLVKNKVKTLCAVDLETEIKVLGDDDI